VGNVASLAKIASAVAIGLPLVVYLAQDALIFYRQPLPEARRAEVARRYPAVQRCSSRPGTEPGCMRGMQRLRVQQRKTRRWSLLRRQCRRGLVDAGVAREAPGVSWLLVDYRATV